MEETELHSDLPAALDPDDTPGPPAYKIKLEIFEGPLDLLLHLIKQEKIDIWNIPISLITEQYLEYLQLMKELNIALAGEFVVMAAQLIYIKSRLLLPPDPAKTAEELDADDPRRELVYQLLEHQKYKQAAQLLYQRQTIESCIWGHPPVEIQEGEDEVISVTLFDVVRAFHQILKRLQEQPVMQVSHEEYTIEQKMQELRQLLLLHQTVRFSQFLTQQLTRRHLIVIFLAILELSRQREIRFAQDKMFGEIVIRRLPPRAADIDPAWPDEHSQEAEAAHETPPETNE